jgi:hypothetical protein
MEKNLHCMNKLLQNWNFHIILHINKLNSRPRKIYGFKIPNYLFSKYIHKKNVRLVIEPALDEKQFHLHGNLIMCSLNKYRNLT